MSITLVPSKLSPLDAVVNAAVPFATSLVVVNTPQLASASEHARSLGEGDNGQLYPSLVAIEPQEDIGSILFNLAEIAAEDSKQVAALIPSDQLLGILPTLENLTKNSYPIVINVFPSTTPDGVSDLADALAIRDAGCAFVCSSSVQEAYNQAIVSHIVSKELKKPFVHIVNIHNQGQKEISSIEEIKLSESTSVLGEFSIPSDDKGEEEADTSPSQLLLDAFSKVSKSLFGTENSLASYTGDENAKIVFLSIGSSRIPLPESTPAGVLQLKVYRPFPEAQVNKLLASTASKVVALEQSRPLPSVWGPLLFDLATLFQDRESSDIRPVLVDVRSTYNFSSWTSSNVDVLLNRLSSCYSAAHIDADELLGRPAQKPITNGSLESYDAKTAERVNQLPYAQMLRDTFKSRLNIINGLESSTIWGPPNVSSSNPEFGFGKVALLTHQREKLAKAVADVLADPSVDLSPELSKALSVWLSSKNDPKVATEESAQNITNLIGSNKQSVSFLETIVEYSSLLPAKSQWLIGADEWSYDLGSSGVHHVISSGLNVNMLVLDTIPYTERNTANTLARGRKKDIGLYAMNYGHVYVASVAVYSSYTHVLQALVEADSYPGPSVVLAYLPSTEGISTPSYSPIAALQESKLAVDTGYWPLYRWNPDRKDDDDKFTLDSPKIKEELRQFLLRESNLALLGKEAAKLSSTLQDSIERKEARKANKTALQDMNQLLNGLQGPPLLVLFASDNGNAEEAARRIERGGKRRGMTVRCMSMDEFEVDELPFEKTVVFSVSTAGQGEFPTNGREFWKTLSSASINLNETQVSVFGLGDSHYWPREEDKIYYNKPARDLEKKLTEFGAQQLVSLHLADDQDSDGWETGFQAWEPKVWEALNLDIVEGVVVDEPQKISDEQNKINSNYLRGTIKEALEDESSGTMGEYDAKILKFHGSYGQDDRDLRAERLARGEEKAYSFMIRVRLPAGVATPEQWLAMDELSDKYGNHTLKITTRQTFQLHGVLKRDLKSTMRGINKALMDTIAACGDVNRNVVASANPHQAHLHPELVQFAKDISSHLLPNTTAYHEIWLNDKVVAGNAVQDYEPLYGATYLPRKFKIAIAIPPENDVDVFAYDLGYIAILDEAQENIVGYNVVVGGGMGMTHNNKKTYPCLARMLGFVTKDKAVDVGEKVMLVQRDHGDRTNRKHARLKYTVDDHGVDWYREQVEERLGYKLEPPRPYEFSRNGDRYGWVPGKKGHQNFTMFIQNGRVADFPGLPIKSGLQKLAKVHKGLFRLTCNGHLIVADVPDADVPAMKKLLAELRLDNLQFSSLRLHSMACAALPTCGLAMAESERYLPSLITLLDRTIDEAGLRNDAIVIRMTGCPNGCARPYNAEIALVGKALGAYNLYLGGSHNGDRLGKIYKESVNEEQILEELSPLIKQYAIERNEGEYFGDFVIRKAIVKATREGKDFHD
ncbi:Sulfite reductase [NADPH] subunit beta [Mycoemilia scoparia]|uniref:assimilatory sulfite reductase (NADPH) n=1 Tax=Mycoemilia scoparia TaxID=417184 RepID=A0A9W8DUV4_9FUNG|nr:Sulfite reductase [NADPH] subunit beta [Mycoemilia scoparia]